MGELGEKIPKCLIKYNGETLIQRTLRILINCGITDITVVVGYLEKQIREHINSNFSDRYINYLVNPDYIKKENIYSVWVARDAFDNDILMMDADLIINTHIMKRITGYNQRNFIVVRKETHEDEMIVSIKDRRVVSLSNDQTPNNLDFDSKVESVGIIKFSKNAAKEFVEKIKHFVDSDELNNYYEAAINLLFKKNTFSILELDENSVVEEIDTIDDIERLRTII